MPKTVSQSATHPVSLRQARSLSKRIVSSLIFSPSLSKQRSIDRNSVRCLILLHLSPCPVCHRQSSLTILSDRHSCNNNGNLNGIRRLRNNRHNPLLHLLLPTHQPSLPLSPSRRTLQSTNALRSSKSCNLGRSPNAHLVSDFRPFYYSMSHRTLRLKTSLTIHQPRRRGQRVVPPAPCGRSPSRTHRPPRWRHHRWGVRSRRDDRRRFSMGDPSAPRNFRRRRQHIPT